MPDHVSTRSLYHVTAIASGAQANLDFYTPGWSSVRSTSMRLRHLPLLLRR